MVPWHSFFLRLSSDKVNVHMDQSGFARNLVEESDLRHHAPTPNATPYHSSTPIDAIPTANMDYESPAQKRCTAAYQSIVGCVRWLSNNTPPDLSAVHSFLSSYLIHPAPTHMKATLYVLHYIHSTHNFGISFSSRSQESIHV